MATNPFEDDHGSYRALCNEEGQYSLWPALTEIPGGWTSQYGPDTKTACLAYIEERWADMRPKSLAEQMKKDQSIRSKNLS
jgi:MbtH protein